MGECMPRPGARRCPVLDFISLWAFSCLLVNCVRSILHHLFPTQTISAQSIAPLLDSPSGIGKSKSNGASSPSASSSTQWRP